MQKLAENVQVVPGAFPGQRGRYLGFWKATHVDTLNRKFALGATIGDREARECGPPPLRAPTVKRVRSRGIPGAVTAWCASCGWRVTVAGGDSRITGPDMSDRHAHVTPVVAAARCATRLLAEHRRDKHPNRVRLGKGA